MTLLQRLRATSVCLRVSAILFALGAIAICYYVYSTASIAIDAEQTHHAYLAVLEAASGYIEDENEWPAGWKELSEYALRKDPSRFACFKDTVDLSRRVNVRFDIRLLDVATMTTEDFTAIMPRGANYGTSPGRINRILELATTNQNE